MTIRTACGNEDGDWAYDFVVAWFVPRSGVRISDCSAETPLVLFHLDSLDLVEFVMTVEDEFHVATQDIEAPLDTIGDLADWLRRSVRL